MRASMVEKHGCRLTVFVLLFISISFFSYADVSFGGLDLSESNFLLYRISADYPGFGSYETLFIDNLVNGKSRQLTFFPEAVLYLKETGQVQIQNRFGVFRTDYDLGNLSTIAPFSSFLTTRIVERGKILPMSTSPDGRYLLYAKNVRGVLAELVLSDLNTKKEAVMISECEVDFDKEFVLWSDDSRYVLYAKNNSIYYYAIDQFKENRVLAEHLRIIGKGGICNVRWGGKDFLYYVDGSLVYKIFTRDFFTRSFYKDIFSIGMVMGRIPYDFDRNFDNFWIPASGDKLILDKGGRNIILCYLKSDDFPLSGNIYTLPYLCLPASSRVKRVIWPETNIVTILTHSLDKGAWKSSVFRLVVPEKEGTATGFLEIKDEQIEDMVLSPSGESIALVKKDKIDFKDYTGWTYEDIYFLASPFSVTYKDESAAIIAGAYSTVIYDFAKKADSLVAISMVTENGFSEDGNYVLAKSREKAYQMSVEGGAWKAVSQYKVKPQSSASSGYRAYLSTPTNDSFANMIMVRNLKREDYGTYPIFEATAGTQFEAFPRAEEAYDLANFNHGSRLRKREVAIVFDVVDSVQGLSTVLDALSEAKLKCTFFINGEALRRYPGAVREIANSGHECASMFYAFFNMTDSKYMLDKEFIKTGLAENETAFYKVTGKELVLFWHAPYYFVNSKIIEVSKEIGYVYAGRDVNTLDWVTEDASNLAGSTYYPAAKLVEKILKEKKPGSIIPINVGIPEEKRDDYLYDKLALLIKSLQNLGYDIVPVSVLYEHAK